MATRHVIVGGGTAGHNAIVAIRQEEADRQRSEIILVAAERPYSRMVLPYYLDRMDVEWEMRHELETPWLTKKPSDVVREADICFSVEAGETLLPQTIEYLGDDHFLYASDVPHWDADFRGGLAELWERSALPTASKEKIFYHNARRLFGLQVPQSVGA